MMNLDLDCSKECVPTTDHQLIPPNCCRSISSVIIIIVIVILIIVIIIAIVIIIISMIMPIHSLKLLLPHLSCHRHCPHDTFVLIVISLVIVFFTIIVITVIVIIIKVISHQSSPCLRKIRNSA